MKTVLGPKQCGQLRVVPIVGEAVRAVPITKGDGVQPGPLVRDEAPLDLIERPGTVASSDQHVRRALARCTQQDRLECVSISLQLAYADDCLFGLRSCMARGRSTFMFSVVKNMRDM